MRGYQIYFASAKEADLTSWAAHIYRDGKPHSIQCAMGGTVLDGIYQTVPPLLREGEPITVYTKLVSTARLFERDNLLKEYRRTHKPMFFDLYKLSTNNANFHVIFQKDLHRKEEYKLARTSAKNTIYRALGYIVLDPKQG